MFSRLAPVFALALVGSALADTLTINTPTSLIVCEPSAITYSGGTAPYYISVLPGGETTSAALETFPTQTAAGSYTWTVDIAADTTVTLSLKDSTGTIAYTAEVTIQSGSDNSCLSSSSASGTSGTSGTSTTAAAETTSSSSSTTKTSTSSISSTSSSSSSSSSAAATTMTSSATTSGASSSTSAASSSTTTTSASSAGRLAGFSVAAGAVAVAALLA